MTKRPSARIAHALRRVLARLAVRTIGRRHDAVVRSGPRCSNIHSPSVKKMKTPKKNASSCDKIAPGRGVTCRAEIHILKPKMALKPLPRTRVHSTARSVLFVVINEADSQYMMAK